jgi:hypothetical protein
MVLLAPLPDGAIRCFITLRPPNAVRGWFDEAAGETSALISQSQFNGEPNFVEAQPFQNQLDRCPRDSTIPASILGMIQ